MVFQSIGNEQAFIYLFKQRLYDIFRQNWSDRLSDTSRGSYYISINPDINFLSKSYGHFECVKSVKNMYILIKLRTCSHRLGIETGRWHRPQPIPRLQRLCDTCGVLDDEYHFVMECRRHTQLRRQYLSPYYFNRPNMLKFVTLLNSEDHEILMKLARFIRLGFEARE